MKILINPGHAPGIDSGAVNFDYNLQECHVALEIGRRVADYLNEAGGYEVWLHQSDNIEGEGYYDYEDSIVGQANNGQFDFFVSIHCNASADGEAYGTETLVYGLGGVAAKLAGHIQKNIINTIGTYDRGVRVRKDLAVLRDTDMPAVLVETAFIDNVYDVQCLLHCTDDFAKAIALGITDYVAEVSHE